MQIELKIPEVGESIQEAVLAQWYKSEGDYVKKEEPVFVIETDKVTLEVPCEAAGILHILVQEGETVPIGHVVGTIETEGAPAKAEKPEEVAEQAPEAWKAKPSAEKPPVEKKPAPAAKPAQQQAPADLPDQRPMMPSVQKLIQVNGIDPGQITPSGPNGMITRSDVLIHLDAEDRPKTDSAQESGSPASGPASETMTRVPMTPIRKRIAQRLLQAKQNTAMLTTFNEIDMSRVMGIRNQYKDSFFKKYDTRLGFMSFFIKATVAALMEFPDLNASIEGDDLVYHDYYHIGVAIGAAKGLVVPVIRNADKKGFAELEQSIVDFVTKIKSNQLTLTDMEGGTFTITNGGVYGSLLSTPILNIPQSGILGMHKIEERPVVVDKQIVIRPMMYVAMSYDHRIVDGKSAVTFLRRIKEFMESPERMIMEI